MNVCAKQRQKLALLAIDALDGHEAEQLRAHAAECSGCRDYLREISHVAQKIHAEGEPEAEPSPFFHHRVRNRLLVERPRAIFPWKLLIPAMAALVFVLLVFPRSQKNLPPVPEVAPAPALGPTPATATVADPTALNYQAAANKSLDALDALLKLQASSALPSAPVYRAGFANTGD